MRTTTFILAATLLVAVASLQLTTGAPAFGKKKTAKAKPTQAKANENLIAAAKAGNTNKVKAALKDGAIVNFKSTKHEDRTALIIAAKGGYDKVVLQLLATKGVEINEKDKSGGTALFYAASKKHVPVVGTLIRASADGNVADKDGTSPLMIASFHGYSKVVEKLINADATVNQQNDKGATALHFAAIGGRANIISQLATAPNKAFLSAVTKQGWRALNIATARGDNAVVQKLISHDVNLMTKDKDGETALHLAVSRTKKAPDTMLEFLPSSLRSSVKVTALPSTTASATVMKSLIAAQGKGELLNFRNNADETPFLLAAKVGNKVAVKLLKASGVDLTAKDKKGNTALHLAAQSRNKDMVTLLVSYKTIEVEATNAAGKTAYQVANDEQKPKIAQILKNARKAEEARMAKDTTPVAADEGVDQQADQEADQIHLGHEVV